MPVPGAQWMFHWRVTSNVQLWLSSRSRKDTLCVFKSPMYSHSLSSRSLITSPKKRLFPVLEQSHVTRPFTSQESRPVRFVPRHLRANSESVEGSRISRIFWTACDMRKRVEASWKWNRTPSWRMRNKSCVELVKERTSVHSKLAMLLFSLRRKKSKQVSLTVSGYWSWKWI